ncbi:hypothetical protein [Streptomyces sp. AS02]|uniref:hypothetical protein n=1 Tax=Streptomyces sp. AS02 TaxID=2938946 RepID=UPI002021BFA5|nr:hypothetical protein [Streptomyces sp. AS02]MCL8014416.1 hypothetical protein [Streptomyces sp. AS02]
MRPARFLAALVSAALATTLAGAGTAQAQPSPDHNCVFEGININQLLGITERVIGPPPCREALAGERWVRVGPSWQTAGENERKVYPPRYQPQDPDPIDDFNAKFLGARYVLDRGTAQERTFVFGREVLRTGFVGADGRPFSIPASPPFEPLSIGRHTVVTFLRFSAEHCDGLGRVREQNCVPAGELPWTGDTPFEVFPRSA